MLAAETLGLGHGLAAEYFEDSGMSNLAATRIDPQVDFHWGGIAPIPSLPSNGFSVRWNGKFQAPTSETYTFYATSGADDGLRLSVFTADLSLEGGRKANVLVDTWSSHTSAEQSGSLTLVAGETYDVTVEYVHASGSADVALRWSSPSTAKAVIPGDQLYPTQSLAVDAISGTWLNADVGSPAAAGSFSIHGKTHTITGAGSGINGTADQFQFAYQVLQGDGVAVVKVDGLSGSPAGSTARVGLLVRDGLSADALYAGIFLTGGNALTFQARDTAGQPAAEVATQADVAAPAWLKLARRGATVNGYVSSTGADDSWTFFGRADIHGLGDAVLIGVGATAGNSAANPITGHLSNVSLATDIPLAGGLGYLATYVSNLPFIDLVKAGCGPAYQLDANGNIASTFAVLDENGWPTQDFAYRGPYAQKPDALAGRDCQLTFTGKATVSIVAPGVGTATPASAATGDPDYTAGYNEAANSSKWYLRTTDASGANGTGVSPRFRDTQRTDTSAVNTGITNIQLLQPGYTSYDSQHVFTQEWLDLVRPLTEVRMKDWACVDGNLTADWSERFLPTTPNQMGVGAFHLAVQGVAWEYLVQFCNLAHKDMWLSVPAHANSEYILKLAQLLRYGSDGRDPYTAPQANPVFPGLDPDLNVYLEYSNEVWNGGFEACQYTQGQAWAAYQAGTRYGPNQAPLNFDGRTWTSGANQDLMYRWLGAHLKQDIVDQFAAVFGAGAINARIRPILSGWMAYADRTCEEGLKMLSAAGWTPDDSLYGITVAGYYGYNDLAAAQVAYNASRANATKEDTLDTFEAMNGVQRGSLVWPVASALAASYGLKLTAYEAGPSLGTTPAQGSAQMDDAFQGIENSIVNSWYASGAEQYNFSFMFFAPSYGSGEGDFFLSDNRWDMNQPRAKSLFGLATAESTPPVVDGFAALPSGELEARYYVNNAAPDPMYMTVPYNWESSRNYRYMVRSLVEQDVDLRLSVAATAAGQRIQLFVNNTAAQTYDYAAAGTRDPANNYFYADTAPVSVHLRPGINMLDLTCSNTVNPQNAKAQINSLKFSPVGGTPGNTLPWVTGLPGNPQNTVTPSIYENQTATYQVDVQDAETPAVVGQPSPFTVLVESDNPTLLPNDSSHISKTYSTATTRWAVAVTPAANQTGSVHLRVTVSDSRGGTRSWTILVNVFPAPPTAVTATAAADGTVTVAWTNNSLANPTFKIERSLDSSNGNLWGQVGLTAALGSGSASWSEKPPGGLSYFYRITPITSGGITGNVVFANSNASVAVPASAGGTGLNATNLFTDKTCFASSVDSTGNGGGRSVRSAMDGTSQFFAFSGVSSNSLAVTGLEGTSGIDTLKFSFPSTSYSARMPNVSIYYSPTDYTAAGQTAALNPANYTRLGSSSFALYQANVLPTTAYPEGTLLTTLAGLAVPADSRSVLLVFDNSQAAPQLAEVQAFSTIGTQAPTDLAYTTAWTQFDPLGFANYVGASVSLTWSNPNAATSATSFIVQRDTSNTFGSTSCRSWTMSLNATGFVNDRDNQDRAMNPYAVSWDSSRNTLLRGGATYYYRVGARQSDGSVNYSSPLTVVTASAAYPTATPSGFAATAVSNYQIDLHWNAVPEATAYKIEKSTRSDFRDTNYAMARVTGTSYSDPTLTPNSVWYYRVRAVGPAGDSDWATATATTLSITAPPTGLAAEADEGTIRLDWSHPTGKIYAYEVYRGTSAGSLAPYKTYAVGQSAILVPGFFDTELPAGATYYYAVRGVLWTNNTVPSQLTYTDFSNVASATVPQANLPPTLTLSNAVTAISTNTSVRQKVADIAVNDDALGNNVLSLSGQNSGLFEIDGAAIYLKAGAAMDAWANAVVEVTVEVDDATVGLSPDDSKLLALAVSPLLDVDQSGTVNGMGDGLLVLRYLFDFRGSSLVRGLVGPDSQRSDPLAIAGFLDACKSSMLDVDGNGTADGMTDGLLVLRYLFDFRGAALVRGSIGRDATRTTPEQVSTFIQSYLPPAPAKSAPKSAATPDPRSADTSFQQAGEARWASTPEQGAAVSGTGWHVPERSEGRGRGIRRRLDKQSP
jgi:hypothetical protein